MGGCLDAHYRAYVLPTVSRHVIHYYVQGRESVSEGGSKANAAEAQAVAAVVRVLLTRSTGMRQSDVGVVTPYIAQVLLALSTGHGSNSVPY